MGTFLKRQLLLLVPVMFGVSLLVFVIISISPGSAAEAMVLQGGAQVSGKELELLREEMGLNDPLPEQYVNFLGKAVRGDLGRSLRSNRSVTEMLLEQFPATAQLALAGMGLAVVLGLVLGILSALHHNSWLDTVGMVLALLGWSMPAFWLGLILILVFSLQLGWFPVTGQGGLERLVLPAVTLALGSAGLIARLVRAGMLDVMRAEYVTTARAKGLRERQVILRHILRNAMIPVVTMVGLQFGRLLSGTVIIETVFARQGLGRVTVDAILARDMPVVQGAVLLFTVIYVLSNLAVDISYAFVDPRIRHS